MDKYVIKTIISIFVLIVLIIGFVTIIFPYANQEDQKMREKYKRQWEECNENGNPRCYEEYDIKYSEETNKDKYIERKMANSIVVLNATLLFFFVMVLNIMAIIWCLFLFKHKISE